MNDDNVGNEDSRVALAAPRDILVPCFVMVAGRADGAGEKKEPEMTKRGIDIARGATRREETFSPSRTKDKLKRAQVGHTSV